MIPGWRYLLCFIAVTALSIENVSADELLLCRANRINPKKPKSQLVRVSATRVCPRGYSAVAFIPTKGSIDAAVTSAILMNINTLHGPQGLKGDKGDVGERGPQGLSGPEGQMGPQGLPGERGLSGEMGPKGDSGERGQAGPKGDKGEAGTPGLPGAKGEKGDKGDTGATGMKGDKGDRGAQGEQGQKGMLNAADCRVATKEFRYASGRWYAPLFSCAESAPARHVLMDHFITYNYADASNGDAAYPVRIWNYGDHATIQRDVNGTDMWSYGAWYELELDPSMSSPNTGNVGDVIVRITGVCCPER